MNSMEEIETAIINLPEKEMRQLSEWLQSYLSDRWEQQMAADVSSGKLDRLLQRVNADIETNRIKSLDYILNDT